MRFVEDLCPPALLYLILLVVQLGLDLSLGLWVTFLIKALIGVATVVVLDMVCGAGLTPVSWFLVAAPFFIMSIATAISLGVGFDAYVLEQFGVRETFYDKKAKTNDLPADSNAITE
jgi:hypothetical protein